MSPRTLLAIILHVPLLVALASWYGGAFWSLLLVPWLAVVVWSLVSSSCRWWGPVLAHFPTRSREVLITFQGRLLERELSTIMELMAQYQARGLFFVTGNTAQKQPELLRSLAQAGHVIGTSMLTDDSASYWKLGPRRLHQQLRRCRALLSSALPEGTELRWFRAPGELNHPFAQDALVEQQLERISHSVADDGALLRDGEAVLLRMRRSIHPGAIIRLTLGQLDASGAEALPWLLEELLLWLRGQGYTLG
jgi:peptidoglycan-N-acetylglucosamine deacetylase